MACRGLLLALTEKQKDALLALPSDEDRIERIDEIHGSYDDDAELVDYCSLDKSWDGLHRSFSGAELLEDGRIGDPTLPDDPLCQAILGGVSALQDEEAAGWITCLVDPAAVSRVAAALTALTPAEFTERYHRYCKGAYPEYGDEDLEYSLEYLEMARDFYNAVAKTGRWVLFSADQ